MQLTCLNCLGGFEVPDSPDSPTAERHVRCPVCGMEGTFRPRDASALKRPSVPLPPRAKSAQTTTAFRKPLQAFSGAASRPATPPSTPADRFRTSRPAAQATEPRKAPPVPVEPPEPPEPLMQEVVVPPVAPVATESGPWLVRSPTGLVFEFPASDHLITWSAVVDNPAPYEVSRGGEAWTSLAEFLRLVRQGSRGTSAFRAAIRETAPQPDGSRAVAPDAKSEPDAQTTKRDDAVSTTAKKHPTSQFQFKIRETRPPVWRKKGLWIGLAIAVLAAAGVAAAFVLGVFG